MSLTIKDDIWFMENALKSAEIAEKEGEVPVGALIVDGMGNILAQAHNKKEKNKNALLHAEMICIEEASKKIKDWRLNDLTLYVSLEPCPMCMAALVQARIGRVVFGAYDRKGGAISIGLNLHSNKKLNHQFAVTGGVKHFECSKIMSDFFKMRRNLYNS
jgi:tRNA(adenine34) deaminase